jgi:hypothetical protein
MTAGPSSSCILVWNPLTYLCVIYKKGHSSGDINKLMMSMELVYPYGDEDKGGYHICDVISEFRLLESVLKNVRTGRSLFNEIEITSRSTFKIHN